MEELEQEVKEERKFSDIEIEAQKKEAIQNKLEENCKLYGCDSYVSFSHEDRYITAYLKKPNYLASVQAFDFINIGKNFQAGNLLFSACYDFDHSDSETQQDKYKIAIVGHISTLLEIATPEFKKK